MRPTIFGEAAIEAARISLAAIANASREIASLQSLEIGQLAVGVDPFLASSVLGPVISEFVRSRPAFKVTVRSGGYDVLERQLLRGELDVIFSFDPQYRTPAVEIDTFQIRNARVVCQSGHPLATKASITFAEVLKYTIVSLPLPAWFIAFAADRIEQEGLEGHISDQIALEADNIEVVKKMVMSSNAITGAFPMDVASELEEKKLVEICIRDWPREITVVIGRRSGRATTPAQDLLEKMFVEMAVELAA